VLAPWGFEECDERVYRAVLRSPGVTVEMLAARLEVSVEDVVRSARKLVKGRLIRRRGDGLAGLRPDVAISALVREAESELARRREELDHMEATIAQFMHDHVLGEQDRGAPPGLEVVTGWDEVNRLVRELMADPVVEVLGMLNPPMGPTPFPGVPSGSAELARRQLPSRTLCAAALLDPQEPGWEAVEAARRVSSVRVSARLPMKMMLVPGRAALLPMDWERQRPDEVLVVRSPALLCALLTIFNLLWERAGPIDRVTAGAIHGADDALLQLLADGLQDEAVADKLGVSVRTVRRRVADLLEDLGARTRFQAGVQAARKGLL
jgi:predicted transcriptional regulator/DNA-binding CsgD family transcriptional regulator